MSQAIDKVTTSRGQPLPPPLIDLNTHIDALSAAPLHVPGADDRSAGGAGSRCRADARPDHRGAPDEGDDAVSRRHVGRRSAAAGGLAMLVLAAAAARSAKAEELDGELIAACREYHASSEEFRRLTDIYCEMDSRSPAAVEIDGKFAVIVARQRELRGEISGLPARTPEGIRAKAAAVLVDLSEDSSGTMEPHDDQYWTAWSLARDIAGRVG